jgi:hypothetical protein
MNGMSYLIFLGVLLVALAALFLLLFQIHTLLPELIGLAAIVLLVLAITLMYLFRRGLQRLQEGE